MSRFKIEDCQIPTIWCGKSNIPKNCKRRYTRVGTRYECMRSGYGAGMNNEKVKHLPKNSLQRIKSVGERYERNLIGMGYKNIPELTRKMQNKTKKQVESELQKAFRKSSGVVDWKAYNSTIEYLYLQGVRHTPNCRRIST